VVNLKDKCKYQWWALNSKSTDSLREVTTLPVFYASSRLLRSNIGLEFF
jgi:hypothetical protein